MGVFTLSFVLAAATLGVAVAGSPGSLDASPGVAQLDRAGVYALQAQAAAIGGAAFVRYYMRG